MLTTWKLLIKNAASTPAKRITRDVLALTAAFRDLGQASAAAQARLTIRNDVAAQYRHATTAIKEQTRALREMHAVAGRPARATRGRPGVSSNSGVVALSPQFQARARALQERNRAAEIRGEQGYYQRLSRMRQASFRENERLANQAQRNQAARAQAQARTGQMGLSLLGNFASLGLGAAAALAGIAVGFTGVGIAAAAAVVDVAAFRESSLVALEAVLGSSAAAGRSFRSAIAVANQTPLDTQDVIQQTQSFAVAGFQEREIAPLIAASADLGAAFGQRSSEGFALALSQIRSAGRLQGQELLQLSNANVSRSAVLDSIARQMNLGQGEVGRRAAQQAITQRRVSSGVGEQAALDAVRGRLDQGGQLGSFARRQSETLTGALSNARNAIFNLLVGIDFSNVPGLVAFKNILLQVTGALSAGSPAANALRQGIMGAANAVGAFLARVINPTTIASGMAMIGQGFAIVQRFAAAAGPVVRAFAASFGPAFLSAITPLRTLFARLTSGGAPSAATLAFLARAAGGLGTVFGFVVGTIASVVGSIMTVATVVTAVAGAITGFIASVVASIPRMTVLLSTLAGVLLGPIGTIAAAFRTAFLSVGTNIVGGIVDGIRGAAGALTTAVTGLGSSAVGAVRGALGIHSPSRVFADMVGAQIPAGIAMGVTGNSAIANDAVSGIVNPRVPQLGGGGAAIHLEINVTGASQPTETARAIRSEIEDALGSIFGQYAEAAA